jgi:hypothetical protein
MVKKALVSTTEIDNVTWVTSWKEVEPPTDPITYEPATSSTIEDTMRVAQVVDEGETFEVYHALIWVDCPDDCVADFWYYKDGTCYIKPTDVPYPS